MPPPCHGIHHNRSQKIVERPEEPEVTYALQGVEGYTVDDLTAAIEKGGRFHIFTWCASFLVLLYQPLTPAIFVPAGEDVDDIVRRLNLRSIILGGWSIVHIPRLLEILASNRDGGVDVTGDVVANLDADSLARGSITFRIAYTHFDHPRRGTASSVAKKIGPFLEENEEVGEVLVGNYVNTGEYQTYLFFGIGSGSDRPVDPAIFEETCRRIRSVFLPKARLDFYDLVDDPEDLADALREQGEVIYVRVRQP